MNNYDFIIPRHRRRSLFIVKGHHDPNFSEEKICRLQMYFNDSTDVGKLYINYPMVESYQHFEDIPNDSFKNTCFQITINKGYQYKNLVKNTLIARAINLPTKLNELLLNRFEMKDNAKRKHCIDSLLSINSTHNIEEILDNLLLDIPNENSRLTARHQVLHILSSLDYLEQGKNYYTFLRNLFVLIVQHNIFKASNILTGTYHLSQNEMQNFYNNLNLVDILFAQNECSSGPEKFVWVLNTSLFFIPDYDTSLIE